jgi:hypothetical protein
MPYGLVEQICTLPDVQAALPGGASPADFTLMQLPPDDARGAKVAPIEVTALGGVPTTGRVVLSWKSAALLAAETCRSDLAWAVEGRTKAELECEFASDAVEEELAAAAAAAERLAEAAAAAAERQKDAEESAVNLEDQRKVCRCTGTFWPLNNHNGNEVQ